jgi:hypothetical protein
MTTRHNDSIGPDNTMGTRYPMTTCRIEGASHGRHTIESGAGNRHVVMDHFQYFGENETHRESVGVTASPWGLLRVRSLS